MTPDARALAPERVEREPHRVRDEHLLEREPGAEAERARAEPADRARRDLEDHAAPSARAAARRGCGPSASPSAAQPPAVIASTSRLERAPGGATA